MVHITFRGLASSVVNPRQQVEPINNIQKMDEGTKNLLFNVIDTYIQNFRTKQAFVKS
ncbi:MAG: hypothetical protein ACI83B_002673 [Sediminicola sp.]